MANGIAKYNSICRVCGKSIIAGADKVKWAPAIRGSSRHYDCYGKLDKYDNQGNLLPETLVQGDNAKGKQGGDEPKDDFIPEVKGQGNGTSDNQKPSGDGDGADTDETTSEGSGEGSEGDGNNADGNGSDGNSESESESKTPPPPPDPLLETLAEKLTPYLDGKLNAKDAKKGQSLQRQIEQAANKAQKKIAEATQKADEAAKKAVEAASGDLAKKIEEKAKEEANKVGDAILDSLDEVLQKYNPPVQIEIKRPEDLAPAKLEGLFHKSVPKLIKLVQRRKNVYLLGPAGSGKSTGAKHVADILGLKFYYISLNPQSSPTRIEGYQTPHGEYVMTLFRQAYEHGGVFCADEVDNSSPNLWTSINNAIDSNLGSFPDGLVARHPDFVFVGTGNTNLNGDAVYRDRKALDKATISRFVFLQWDYDEGLERTIAQAKNPDAGGWIDWVQKLRQYAKEKNPSLFAYCTPRATYDGVDLLADGFTPQECADMVVFKHTFDATAVKAALKECPVPVFAENKAKVAA